MGQLENVLFTVNDLQSSILYETENSISVLSPRNDVSVEAEEVTGIFLLHLDFATDF